MAKLKPFLFLVFITILFLPHLFSQQTYFAADNKFTSLIDTKYLKNGDIVLLEKIRFCDQVRVNILKTDGSTESILSSGRLEFYSFNELVDNNWVLTLITDPTDDVPTPLTFHTVTFIDGVYDFFTLNNGDDTSIPLEEIYNAAVINIDELVLIGFNKTAYFTDFELSTIDAVTLNENLQLMKSPLPDDGFLYYKYVGVDEIRSTEDRFQNEELIGFNFGDNFRDIHYLGNYAIIQDENEISALQGIFGFQYLEQNKTIYDFRQHGQNLRYYTILNENTIIFKKLYLDENEVLRKDSFDIVVSDTDNVPDLHWDANFKGITKNFLPLPLEYADDYRGGNYYLDYNLEDFEINTQNLDISIDDIQYTVSVDTSEIDPGIFLYYADILMEITLTNNTDEVVDNVQLYSSAFEGINCAHNALKVDEDVISIDPNLSRTVTARYESLEFDNQDYLSHPLCVYAISANNKFDQNFDDNIYCLPLSEFTSTHDDIILSDISISPNPARDFIKIETEAQNAVFEIFTLQGERVLSWERKSQNDMLDISTLAGGTYIAIDRRGNSRAMFLKM